MFLGRKERAVKVSVLIVTYNHEKFIETAVRSALAQEADFEFEIVIGEDCSKDGTAAVVKKLAAEFPDRIRAVCNEKNLGLHQNYRQSYFRCRGQYIALLEGDDIWTDKRKLQKQVAYLDASKE